MQRKNKKWEFINLTFLKEFVRACFDFYNYCSVEYKLLNQKIMWREEEGKLKAEFIFKNFIEAFAFMTEVAIYAEKQNHHPIWSNVYNEVIIELTTHDKGNIVTEKDQILAETITRIQEKYSKNLPK